MPVSTRSAHLRMTGAMILSGSIGVLVVKTRLSAATAVFYRCLFGALGLGVYLILVRRVDLSALTHGTFGLMMLSGATMAASWVCFFAAYRYAPISTVTIIYHL